MKSIAVLGSTGSIGTQTLEVVRGQRDLKVAALAAGSNVSLLEAQAREFRPALVAVWDEARARELQIALGDTQTRAVSGMGGLCEAAQLSGVETVVTAIVGMIGIRPTLSAIEAGKDIALANKETLVTAGHLVMGKAREKGVRILPVDSEHSAIFQCLQGQEYAGRGVAGGDGHSMQDGCGRDICSELAHAGSGCADAKAKQQGGSAPLTRIILTASGGPFRGRKREGLRDVTVADALKHPNWSMGRKITVDSATMVNKGLEVMEARWLFGVDFDRIQVVVHPQSVIHSMVEFADGAVLAQLGAPDMKLPIQYALTYPGRRPMAGERLDFAGIGSLTFEEPDMGTFGGLALAYEAGRMGGTMPTVYNAANEWAVAGFLRGELPFLGIEETIRAAMCAHRAAANPDLDAILNAERETYEFLVASHSPTGR